MTAKSRIAILTAALLGATGLGVSPVLAAAPVADAPTTLTAADTHDSSVAAPFRNRRNKKKKNRRTTVIVVDSDQNGNSGGDGGNGGNAGRGGDCRGDNCFAGDGGNGGNGGDGGNGGGNNS